MEFGIVKVGPDRFFYSVRRCTPHCGPLGLFNFAFATAWPVQSGKPVGWRKLVFVHSRRQELKLVSTRLLYGSFACGHCVVKLCMLTDTRPGPIRPLPSSQGTDVYLVSPPTAPIQGTPQYPSWDPDHFFDGIYSTWCYDQIFWTYQNQIWSVPDGFESGPCLYIRTCVQICSFIHISRNRCVVANSASYSANALVQSFRNIMLKLYPTPNHHNLS